MAVAPIDEGKAGFQVTQHFLKLWVSAMQKNDPDGDMYCKHWLYLEAMWVACFNKFESLKSQNVTALTDFYLQWH